MLSTACGVRIGAHAGTSASSTFATGGRIAPWRVGTKTCGIFASASLLRLAPARRLERADDLDDELLGLADDDRVDDAARAGAGSRT